MVVILGGFAHLGRTRYQLSLTRQSQLEMTYKPSTRNRPETTVVSRLAFLEDPNKLHVRKDWH